MAHNTTAYIAGTVRYCSGCATLSASVTIRTPVTALEQNTAIVPVHSRRCLEEKDVD
jgi:hypothetical protein